MLTWDRSLQMSKLFKLFYLFKLLLDFFLRRTHTHKYTKPYEMYRVFFARVDQDPSSASRSCWISIFAQKKFWLKYNETQIPQETCLLMYVAVARLY